MRNCRKTLYTLKLYYVIPIILLSLFTNFFVVNVTLAQEAVEFYQVDIDITEAGTVQVDLRDGNEPNVVKPGEMKEFTTPRGDKFTVKVSEDGLTVTVVVPDDKVSKIKFETAEGDIEMKFGDTKVFERTEFELEGEQAEPPADPEQPESPVVP